MKLFYYTTLVFSCCVLQFPACNAESVKLTGGYERIIGGEVAIKNEFPWLVYLLTDEAEFCGGAILNNEYILTAAHCLFNKSFSIVFAGDHDLDDEDGEQRIRSWTVTVAGWEESNSKLSRYLQKLNVSIVSNEDCQTRYNAAALPEEEPMTITDNMICAQSPGKDSSWEGRQGDSGGPLLCRSGKAIYACGIVSGWEGSQYPGVYTKVPSYLPWIQTQIAKNKKCNANTINNSVALMFTFITTYLLVK